MNNGADMNKLFQEGRLNPTTSKETEKFIAGRLAELAVTHPQEHVRWKEYYDDLAKKSVVKTVVETIVVKEAKEVVKESKAETVIADKPKKIFRSKSK